MPDPQVVQAQGEPTKSIATIVTCAVLLVGCASPQPIAELADPPASRTFDAPREVVWAALAQEVERRFPAKVVDKGENLLTVDFVPLPSGRNNVDASRWIHQPKASLGLKKGLRMSMSATATEVQPGKTRVDLDTNYEEFVSNASHAWQPRQSNGRLEQEILDGIAAHMPVQAITR